MEFLAALGLALAEVGQYKVRIKALRTQGLIRFQPFVPGISQKKRRLRARRCA